MLLGTIEVKDLINRFLNQSLCESCRYFSSSTTRSSPTSVWMLNRTSVHFVFRNGFPMIHFSISSSQRFSSLFTRLCSANTNASAVWCLVFSGISTLSFLSSGKHFCPRRKHPLSSRVRSLCLKNQYQSIIRDQDQVLTTIICLKSNILSLSPF